MNWLLSCRKKLHAGREVSEAFDHHCFAIRSEFAELKNWKPQKGYFNIAKQRALDTYGKALKGELA